MEVDNAVAECLWQACSCLVVLLDNEMMSLVFVDLTVLCQIAGLQVACSCTKQIKIICSWCLSCVPVVDSPALLGPDAEEEEDPFGTVSSLSPVYSVPGSPFQGFSSPVSSALCLPSWKWLAVDDPEGLFPLASNTTSMHEVWKWWHKEAANIFFPECVLVQKWNDFICKAGHVVRKVDLTDASEVEATLKDVTCHIETQLVMVVTSNAEGWDVAQLLEDKTALVFKVNKERLQVAHKWAKQVAA
jgi:hypothetical protein